MSRVIVCGSRRWHDRTAIQHALYDLTLRYAPDYPVIVHGGCRGADQLAGEEAGKAGLLVEVHRADWGRTARALARFGMRTWQSSELTSASRSGKAAVTAPGT